MANDVLDRETLAAFREGDDDAVRAVYRRYASLVFTVAMRVLQNRELAEEAMQQTFVNAWRHGAQFDNERDLAPWLATIARRAAIDVQRRERRRPTSSLDETLPPAANLAVLPPGIDAAWTAWQVRRAIAALDPREAQMVRLHHLDGLTHQEIADRLSMSVGTVKSRLFRAHRQMVSSLRHLREEES